MHDWVFDLPLSLIKEIAKKQDIDASLVAAIVSVESNGRTNAARYEPHFKWLLDPSKYARINSITVQTEVVFQKTSLGLMQVMGAVARELGHEGDLPNLFYPEIGLSLGVKKLKSLLDTYTSVSDAISSYNQGSPKKTGNGLYKNQYYVDMVLRKHLYLNTGAN